MSFTFTRRELLSRALQGTAAAVAIGAAPSVAAQARPQWSFERRANELEIRWDGKPLAVYVFEDPAIPRPFFKDVRTTTGFQVTRNHPPVEGKDPTDHDTFHPGIWLAFGDINGADFWRNKARVRHETFVEVPSGDADRGSFTVRNAYEADGKLIARQLCRCTFSTDANGYFLIVESLFRPGEGPIVFGDQEEMGFGVRMATPLTVKQGTGRIVNSDGRVNEKDVWGKTADWCDYGGTVDGRSIGVTLMPDPKNFRPSWYHARDYGLLVANPFGRKAFTEGEPSAYEVKSDSRFPLNVGVYVHESPETEPADLAAAYNRFTQRIKTQEPLND